MMDRTLIRMPSIEAVKLIGPSSQKQRLKKHDIIMLIFYDIVFAIYYFLVFTPLIEDTLICKCLGITGNAGFPKLPAKMFRLCGSYLFRNCDFQWKIANNIKIIKLICWYYKNIVDYVEQIVMKICIIRHRKTKRSKIL